MRFNFSGLYIFLSLIILSSTSARAQVFLPGNLYMRLLGRIDDRQEATFHLIKMGDSLYGDLVFSDSLVPPVILGGSFDQENGTFRLQEPFSDSGTCYSGSFRSRHSLTGEYSETFRENNLPFFFIEAFPSGSLPFQVFSSYNEYPLIARTITPRAEIGQTILLPPTSGQSEVYDSLRVRIIKWFDPTVSPFLPDDTLLKFLEEKFYSTYLMDTKELIQTIPDAGPLNWISLKYMHVLHNDHHLFCFYNLSYTFTGGAHGMELRVYHLLDTRTGREVTPEDIFLPGFEERLSGILTTQLKHSVGVDPEGKLSEYGYFVDAIPPTSNLYITPAGIGFYYNHYEIAPYSNGPTNIFLSFSDLTGMIRSESVLRPILR